MKTLQVKLDGEWHHVFCYNPTKSDPITTPWQCKALRARDLEFFKRKFGNHEFRVSNEII